MQTLWEARENERFPPRRSGKLRTHWRLGLRLVFGIFWGADAILKWAAYASGYDYVALVTGQATGQPAFVASWIDEWARIISGFPNFALFMAVLETMIALFVFFGLFTNLTSTVGIVFSFLIWSTAEGFGGIFMLGGATDIGPSPLYMALFAGLIITMAGRQLGLDSVLSRRYPRFSILM